MIPTSLAPVIEGANSAAVQIQDTARSAPTRSVLFEVCRSSNNDSHGVLLVAATASETEQRVRRRAASKVRYVSTPYMFELFDARHLFAQNGFSFDEICSWGYFLVHHECDQHEDLTDLESNLAPSHPLAG